jgi:hypothetical protein
VLLDESPSCTLSNQPLRKSPVSGIGLERSYVKDDTATTYNNVPLVGGAKSGALGREIAADLDTWGEYLAIVVEAWPRLPADVKAGILAMVEAANAMAANPDVDVEARL